MAQITDVVLTCCVTWHVFHM